MSAIAYHPEQVRMILRMRYGTMEGFADSKGLKSQAVRDFLRGTSSTAKDAVAQELGVEPDQLQISKISTNVESDTKSGTPAHCQNAGGQ